MKQVQYMDGPPIQCIVVLTILQCGADSNVLIKDTRDKKDQELLKRVGKRIDLLKLADDAYPLVHLIQEFFMKEVAEKDKKLDLKGKCEYLVSMWSRIALYKADAWYVWNYTELENVEVGLPYFGGVLGYGIDYFRLDWKMYKVLLEWINNENIETRFDCIR